MNTATATPCIGTVPQSLVTARPGFPEDIRLELERLVRLHQKIAERDHE